MNYIRETSENKQIKPKAYVIQSGYYTWQVYMTLTFVDCRHVMVVKADAVYSRSACTQRCLIHCLSHAADGLVGHRAAIATREHVM